MDEEELRMEERNNLEIYTWMGVLKWALNKQDKRVWAGFIWLEYVPVLDFCENCNKPFKFHNMHGMT